MAGQSKLSVIKNKTLIYHNGEYKKWGEKDEDFSDGGLIPIMTSDTTPSGIAFSSSNAGSDYLPYKAFDGDNVSTDKGWLTNKETVGYIGYDFGENKQVKINLYRIKPLLGHDAYLERTPKDWFFEGSNNNIDWTVLDTREGISNWNLKTFKVFSFKNDKPYRMYRLRFTSNNRKNNSGQLWTGFSILEMYNKKEGVLEVISSTFPTQEQFLSEGMDSLSPLLDRRVETLEPLPMTDKSEILQAGETGKMFSETLDLKRYIDIRSMKV